MVHTTQLLPTDTSGKVVGSDNPGTQVRQALDNLAHALDSAGSALDHLVRLNAVTADERTASILADEIEARFRLDSRPAVTLVRGDLPIRGVLVALDAVAASKISANVQQKPTWTVSPTLPGVPGSSHAAVMPNGPRAYISGMAADGKPEAAANDVLGRIHETLQHLGASRDQIIQLKCFLRPITAASRVERQIVKSYGGRAPPMVFVEWLNRQAIEIEAIVATAPVEDAEGASRIAYITPPGMRASPVFSRIAHVFHPASIFVSTLNGRTERSGEQPIREMFAELTEILGLAGSDLDHLAKATYYVSDESTSAALNQIRPEFYDSTTPPAASKASVRGTAVPRRSLAVDMIAVPREER